MVPGHPCNSFRSGKETSLIIGNWPVELLYQWQLFLVIKDSPLPFWGLQRFPPMKRITWKPWDLQDRSWKCLISKQVPLLMKSLAVCGIGNGSRTSELFLNISAHRTILWECITEYMYVKLIVLRNSKGRTIHRPSNEKQVSLFCLLHGSVSRIMTLLWLFLITFNALPVVCHTIWKIISFGKKEDW